jgi:L-asparagine transporter-like permease
MGLRYGLKVSLYVTPGPCNVWLAVAKYSTFSYALQWLVTLPLEIIAASITLSYWEGARNVNPAAWVTIFLLVIIAINFFGVKGYGEAEFVFSIIKVVAIIGFMYVLPRRTWAFLLKGNQHPRHRNRSGRGAGPGLRSTLQILV